MKARINFLIAIVPLVIIGILVFIGTLEGVGVDTMHYIDFADYASQTMEGIEPFWGYPGEYSLTIFNKLSGHLSKMTLESKDPRLILALTKMGALLVGIIYIKCNFKSHGISWTRPSSLFLALYFTSDVFMLGFLNSLRTGMGLFFISLFYSSIVGRISDKSNRASSYKAEGNQDGTIMRIINITILLLAATSHNAALLIILLYCSTWIAERFIKTMLLKINSRHIRLAILSSMLLVACLGGIAGKLLELRSFLQLSTSDLAGVKLLFDGAMLIILIAALMPRVYLVPETLNNAGRNQVISTSPIFIFLGASVLLGLCIATYGSETSNRIEQFLRLCIYGLMVIATSRKLISLTKPSWIGLCIILSISLMTIGILSPAVQANLR